MMRATIEVPWRLPHRRHRGHVLSKFRQSVLKVKWRRKPVFLSLKESGRPNDRRRLATRSRDRTVTVAPDDEKRPSMLGPPLKIDCSQALRLLSRRMDHGLHAVNRLRLHLHMRACRRCPIVLRQLLLISKALKRL
jgi:hypothetical protein